MAISSSLHILVVGAGLGGLAAALSIKHEQPHHEVLVVESAPELAEIGAGLQLTPNSTKLLTRWGLHRVLEPLASNPKELTIHRYADGKLLGKRKRYGQEMLEKYGGNFWDMHRADLQIALFQATQQHGVRFKFGATVVKYDFQKPAATLESGEEIDTDLIIAADGEDDTYTTLPELSITLTREGLWSRCRSSFLGHPTPPIPTGDLAYRIVLRRDDIHDETLRDFMATPRVRLWVGPECHAIYYPLRDNTMCNIVLLVPDNLPENVAKSAGDLAEMHAIFQDWDPLLRRFLSMVPKIDKWKLMHLNELEHWYNPEATVAFLGDSCHPMLPYMAQGANLAIEDGAVLGILLSKLSKREQLLPALEVYQDVRKPRSSTMQRLSMKQRYFNHLPDGPEQVERDRSVQEQFDEPKPGYPFYWLDPEAQSNVYGFDVVKQVESYLADGKIKL